MIFFTSWGSVVSVGLSAGGDTFDCIVARCSSRRSGWLVTETWIMRWRKTRLDGLCCGCGYKSGRGVGGI